MSPPRRSRRDLLLFLVVVALGLFFGVVEGVKRFSDAVRVMRDWLPNAVMLFTVVTASAVAPGGGFPRHDAHETVWSKHLAERLGLASEEPIPGGRIDIYNPEANVVCEVEFALSYKAPEALEQAARYGREKRATPTILMLVGRGTTMFERGVVATLKQMGKKANPPIAVDWIDVRRPDMKKVRKLLRAPDAPATQ